MPTLRHRFVVSLVALSVSSGVVVVPVVLTTTASASVHHHHSHKKHKHPKPKPSPRPTATSSPSLTATPTVSPSPTATSTPTSTPTVTTSPSPTSSPTSDPNPVKVDWAAALLVQLNAERAQNALPALKLSAALTASAHTHNLAMAQADTLSHQLGGEAGLGARVSAAGYVWSSCGENIGWNGRRSQDGVLALETAMYNEKAPDDGHRRNILSTTFTEVGVDVIDDSAHGKVWLTTDFGRSR